jgi:hypothetical protein
MGESASGQKLRFRAAQRPSFIVRSTPVSRPSKGGPTWVLSATSGLVQRSKTVALINHLVGAREEGFRDREAHSLRSSEIDGQFELRGLLDG